MFKNKDINVGDLAQAALGGGKFGSLEMILLHSVIKVALKKLNCENEKVTIKGNSAESLQKLLKESGTPVLLIDEKSIHTPMGDLEKICELETKIAQMETGLESHLEIVNVGRSFGKAKTCLLECEVEEVKNEEVGALCRSNWLCNRLNDILTMPINCRFHKFDVELKRLSDRMETFKKDLENALEQMKAFEKLSEELPNLRNTILEYQLEFFNTMVEIQKILDSKANNIDIMELKDFVHRSVDECEKLVQKPAHEHAMPRALAGIFPLPFRKTVAPDSPAVKKSVCSCITNHKEIEVPLTERVNKIDPRKVAQKIDDFAKDQMHHLDLE